MHTITILHEGHSVHRQTSLRASRPFEDGLLNIGSKLLTFLPKSKTHPAMTNSRKLGTEVLFHTKTSEKKTNFSMVWYRVWSTNNSECMEAPVPAVNTVLAMWYKYKYYKIQHFSNILTKNTLWRCSRHAHQAKLELLTWAVASFQKLISYSGSLKPAVSRCVGKWNEVTLIYSGRVAWSLPKSLRFYLEVKMKWPNQTL